MVNRFIYIRENSKKLPKNFDWDTLNHFPTVMKFRLPTKEEWEYASAASLPYSFFPLGYECLVDKKHLPVSNIRQSDNIYYDFKTKTYFSPDTFGIIFQYCIPADITTPVFAGEKNKYGIFNLLGNVSEIIADTLFKGLNYETSLDGSTFKLKKENYEIVTSTSNGYDYKYTFRYRKPQAWLGFRCVCDVLKGKGDKY